MTGDTWRPMAEPTLTWKQYEMGTSALIDLLLTNIGMIRRNISYKDKSLIVPLYKAIVRPHLEYCIQAWSPYLRKDIDMLEKYREEQLNSFQD